MPSVCFYFQVHQPRRIKKYRIFDIGRDRNYFETDVEDNTNNARVLRKIADKSHLPTNALLLELLKRHPEFKISFSLSGIALEQLAEYAPEVIDSFKRLFDTGRVEILGETYYHSLAFFHSIPEFERQVDFHRRAVKNLFGAEPEVFRNTELAYRNDLGAWAEEAGYKAILAEGWDYYLGWRSPNFVYQPKGAKKIKLLLKNYRLSDDIAFRFGERSWSEWPLTADKFASWVSAINGSGVTVNLFLDYETFGEHQWEDKGIFEFLRHLPGELLKHQDNNFKTPSEVADSYEAVDEIDVPHILTWADTERDLSAWTGNKMQESAISAVYALEEKILESGDGQLIEDWRRLQTSDHFYYMCTKWFADGDVHKYFNPYESPYDGFITFMNVLNDIQLRLKEKQI